MANIDFPVLQNEGVLLRQFTGNDLQHVFNGLSHPDVIRYYGVSYTSLEATKAQLQFFKNLEENETGTWWAVCDLNGGEFYGACGLSNLDKTHQKAELGFWLLPQYQGRGIISAAVAMVCHHAFTVFNLHRIEAIVESENTGSKKVMQRLQFDLEGTMKECEYKNGRFISLDFYAKLNPAQAC